MPDLPVLSLTQEHFDRVVAAFPGTTAEEKVDAYRQWLVNRLIERVQAVEIARLDDQFRTARQQAMIDIIDSLPPRVEEPVLPQ